MNLQNRHKLSPRSFHKLYISLFDITLVLVAILFPQLCGDINAENADAGFWIHFCSIFIGVKSHRFSLVCLSDQVDCTLRESLFLLTVWCVCSTFCSGARELSEGWFVYLSSLFHWLVNESSFFFMSDVCFGWGGNLFFTDRA